jgi:hypothetical protein
MRPTVQEVAEWFAFAFHARRRRKMQRQCYNADGSPKKVHKTRRRANRVALKYQESYWCDHHRAYHVGTKRKA